MSYKVVAIIALIVLCVLKCREYSFRFECPEFRTFSSNKCYLKGKTFDIGDNIADEVAPMCRAACRCNEGNGVARIECADIECPEDFDDDHDEFSVSLYADLKQCCSSNMISGRYIDHLFSFTPESHNKYLIFVEDQAQLAKLAKCEAENRTYHVGQRIYPESVPCYQCLCTADFNSNMPFTKNPNCAKIDCGIELDLPEIRDGCAPIYFKTPTCCPIDFKCRKLLKKNISSCSFRDQFSIFRIFHG